MRRTFTAAIGAVSVAAVISGAGLAAASASPARSATPMEQFRGMSISVPGTGTLNIIATGAFTAGGVDIITGLTTDIYRFPGGTIHIRHHAAHSAQTINNRTCLFRVSERGPYRITGGTGRYKGISGSGTGTLSIVAVLVRDSKGKCSLALPPAATQLLLNLHGPIKL
jgi:hypothetical protein